MLRYAGAVVAVLAFCAPAVAQQTEAGAVVTQTETGFVSYTIKGNFDDVEFDLEDAINAEGLLIDYRGYVNKMLENTAEAVGAVAPDGSKSPFIDATYLHFCSGKLTHDAVDADPANVAICPYLVYVYELRSDPGMVTVGYRRPVAFTTNSPKSAVALGNIDALLNRIVRKAAGL
jgi:uncharacterized protein (DUF302 family)